jgi:hypothetical protein
MKWIINVIAVLVTLAGIVFFLQGTNVLPVGGMAGQSQWTIIGAVMAMAGIAALFVNNRRG